MFCADGLPNVIARAEAYFFTGGMTSRNALSNADAAGSGPKGSFSIGKKIVYPTRELFAWCWDKGFVARDGLREVLSAVRKAGHSRSMSPRILPADLQLSDEHGGPDARI